MVDLAPIILIAQTLITENGREVTFIQHSDTLEFDAQPWEGPADARTAPASIAKMDAVFFNPSEAAKLGISFESPDLLKRAEQIMMVSPGTVDIRLFQEVLDENVYWKILGAEIFKPGKLVAIAYVAVGR